jgi:hypothetical protein
MEKKTITFFSWLPTFLFSIPPTVLLYVIAKSVTISEVFSFFITRNKLFFVFAPLALVLRQTTITIHAVLEGYNSDTAVHLYKLNSKDIIGNRWIDKLSIFLQIIFIYKSDCQGKHFSLGNQ